MPHYLTHERLAKLVRQAQESKTLTPELYNAVKRIVVGCRGSEDVVQVVAISVWRHLDQLDADRNPFAWITTCTLMEMRQQHRNRLAHERKCVSLAMHQGWVPANGNGRRMEWRFQPKRRKPH